MTIQELLSCEKKIAVAIVNQGQWDRLHKLGFRTTNRYWNDSEDCYSNKRTRAGQRYYIGEGTPIIRFEDIQFEQIYEIY